MRKGSTKYSVDHQWSDYLLDGVSYVGGRLHLSLPPYKGFGAYSKDSYAQILTFQIDQNSTMEGRCYED